MTSDAIDTAVRQAREIMDGFMVAFNAEDADAMRKHWFNFPHVRFHGGRVTIMERPEDFHSTVWERLGEAKGWARTAWDYVELVDAGPAPLILGVGARQCSLEISGDVVECAL